MARILDTIIQQEKAPTKTNVLWQRGSTLYIYKDDKWTPLIAGEEELHTIHVAYSNSKDGVTDFNITPDASKDYDYLGVVVQKALSDEELNTPSTYNWNKVVGKQGEQGIQGIKGDQGPKGDRGASGLNGITYKPIVIYTTYTPTDNNPLPILPTTAYWDLDKDEIILGEGSNWTITDNIQPPVWMSIGQFSDKTPSNPTWSTPQRISGEKGKDGKDGTNGLNGVDGVNIEFIYCNTENENKQPPTITNSDKDDYVPEGWNPSPQGISSTNKVEWCSVRKKNSSGHWENFETPFIWSKWGINGTDGDGVQYIYARNKGMALENPIDEYLIDVDSDKYQEIGEFENVEFIPGEDGFWSDNPKGVDTEYTHEWCCKRKYRNGKWERYSDPSLWAKYGENGINGSNGVSVKCKYTTTNSSSEIPSVNSSNNNPGSHWSTAIPNYTNKALWEIQAYVDNTGNLITVSGDNNTTIFGWQGPILKSGLDGKDAVLPNYNTYVYYQSNTPPSKPTTNNPSTEGWKDYPDSTGQWYQCVGIVDSRTGNITWGEVLPLNGKDGDAQTGNSWETRFAPSNDYNTPPSLNKTVREPIGWIRVDQESKIPQIPEGGAMWQIWAEITSSNALVNQWSDPIRVSGERGPIGETGATGKTGPIGPTGLHGISIDLLYCLGTEDRYTAPNAPTSDNTSGWTSIIPTITNEYPYIWCSQGRKIYNNSVGSDFRIEWGTPFRLSGINGIGKEGRGVSKIENYYTISNSSSEAPTNWESEGNIPQLTEDKPYLWNYEKVIYTDGAITESKPQVISVTGANGRNITNIIEYYAISKLETGVTYENTTWYTEPVFPDETYPYLWNYEEIKFDKGEPILTEPIRIGNYSKGEPGEKGAIGKIVYPAGVYDYNQTYTTTETTCPYVFDTDYNNYYILNADRWEGKANPNISPGKSYEDSPNIYWTKMEFYEAIYSKVGIIANGLIGSVVFNGDYMFSQQGLDENGNFSNSYENFGITTNNETVANDPNFSLDRSDLKFYPTLCFNLKTGDGYVANKNISWDNSKVTFGDRVTLGWHNIDKSSEVPSSLLTQISNSDIITNKINAVKIDASQITSGVLSADRIQGLTIDASNIKGLDIFGETIKGSNILGKNLSSNVLDSLANGTTYKPLKTNWNTLYENWLKEDPNTRGEIPSIFDATITTTNNYTNGPTWQIHNDGSGYFAKGNFRWSSGGDVTVNGTITGTIGTQSGDTLGVWNVTRENNNTILSTINGDKIKFSSDGSGHLAGGNITWSNTGKVTFKNDINFDTDVKISWNNIDGNSVIITKDQIEANSITGDKIDAQTITANNIKSNTITSKEIAANTITSDNIAANTITGSNIKAGTITTTELSADAIKAENIKGTTITGKTIRSDKNISGTTTPTWQIENTGAGWLANKNIEWTDGGNLTVKGKITAGTGSKFGSWYTWNDGTISTAENKSNSTPNIQFNKDGSGHLCYENISWDDKGNLHLGALDDKTVVIGDEAWTVTKDGIKSKNNNVYFKNDGSGYIGGIGKNTEEAKGLSWDDKGVVKINTGLLYNVQDIYIDSTSDIINISKINKYIINNPKGSITSGKIKMSDIYLSWWGDKLSNGEQIDVEFLNNSDFTIDFTFGDNMILYIPKKIKDFTDSVVINYGLAQLTANEILDIFLLPATTLSLSIIKQNDNIRVYINEIGTLSRNKSLTSITPDLNNYSIPYAESLESSHTLDLYTFNIFIVDNDVTNYYRTTKISKFSGGVDYGTITPSSTFKELSSSFENIRIVNDKSAIKKSFDSCIKVKSNDELTVNLNIGVPSHNLILKSDPITCIPNMDTSITFTNDIITKLIQLAGVSPSRTLDINIILD